MGSLPLTLNGSWPGREFAADARLVLGHAETLFAGARNDSGPDSELVADAKISLWAT